MAKLLKTKKLKRRLPKKDRLVKNIHIDDCNYQIRDLVSLAKVEAKLKLLHTQHPQTSFSCLPNWDKMMKALPFEDLPWGSSINHVVTFLGFFTPSPFVVTFTK